MRRELEQERHADARVLPALPQVLEIGRRVPRHDRDRVATLGSDVEGDEAAEARAEQAETSVETPMRAEELQHRAHVVDPRADRRLVLAARGLAASAEVEPRQREPRPGKRSTEQQVLVAVLRG